MEKKRQTEKESLGGSDALAMAILNKNKSRAEQANNFFDSLIDKYSNTSEKSKKKGTPSKTASKKRKA